VDTVVVADASPLIALDRIGRLDLIMSVFPVVFIPSAVAREAGTELLSANPWLRVRERRREQPAWVQPERLDPGEFEALLLAIELAADVVLMDDLPGRKWAERHGILVTGTFGILLTAKQAGVIAAVAPVLDQLAASGFRASEAVMRRVLAAAGEA